ncbi:MAG: uracil-DNA glycosylase [Emcibacter sp.]|nr:uracil-DNA glycosylase [Emcibacter sp.]
MINDPEINLKVMENSDILSLLQWYRDCGVDEAIGDEETDCFTLAHESHAKLSPQNHAQEKAPLIISSDHLANKAEQVVAACHSLDDLNDAIEAFDGCSLKKTATHTVFSDGNQNSHIMLIGDAPGVDEDRYGKPFMGENGVLLDKMFKAIGLSREDDFYLSYILPWRPPGNRAPTPEEITICMPFIKRHIELFKPKMIILLGAMPASNILQSDVGITRLRGKWKEYILNDDKIPVIAMFHPNYLLKQPKAKKDAWQDLLEIKSKIEGLFP